MPAETNLLLSVLRTTSPPIETNGFRHINWDRLIRLAERHCVLPLLRQRLGDQIREKAPAAYKKIYGEVLKTAGANLALTSELLRILARFQSSGIPVVPFKGAVLSQQLYGDAGIRQFSDIDLLVGRADAGRSERLLEELGFSAPTVPRNPRAHVLPMTRGVTVELHRSLMDDWFGFDLTAEALGERLVPVRLRDRTVSTLSAEDNLVFLSAHGCKHRWSRLIWVCDIAALFSSATPPDWSAVCRTAGALDASRMVRLAVYLAMSLLGCPIPDDVRRAVLADNAAVRIGDQIVSEYQLGFTSRERALHGKDTSRYYLAIRERARSRMRYCLYLLWYRWQPTGKDLSVVSLPGALHGIYYLLRPFRLLKEYGWRPVKSYASQFMRILLATGKSAKIT